MPRANEQKIKLLVLYDILQRETDEEHPLSTNEIIERLSARGIEVSRKILPGDIALLNKYGFEIAGHKKGKSGGDSSDKYSEEKSSTGTSEETTENSDSGGESTE